MIELALLNAVIEKRDYSALVKNNLADDKHFIDQKEAFIYIQKHLQEYGELPSKESVVLNCPTFEIEESVESIDTLSAKLTERNLKIDTRKSLELMAREFSKKDAYGLLSLWEEQLDDLREKANARGKNGVNWSTSGHERYLEYEARKKKDFAKKIPCMFDEVTEAIGGYELSELVTIMAFTSRGKSWLGLLSALVANNAGFKVLIESAEMSKAENQFRLDTLQGKFSNKGLWTGTLENNEDEYKEYTEHYTKENSHRSDLIIKTSEDWADGLSLQQLEADIDKTGCDMVVIDQFNLMRFKSSSRDDKSAMSRALKQIAAKKSVVIVLLYQTNGQYEKDKGKAEDGLRELKSPELTNYSETISVIQDSNKIYGFDSVTWRDETTGRQRGKALVSVLKSRSGGEGSIWELQFMPNDGIIETRKPTDIF